VEGQVSIANKSLSTDSTGSIVLGPDQILATQNGKAEILFTPGVFARVGERRAVELTKTQFSVEKGEAIIEVDPVHPANSLLVSEDRATVQLQKTGLYDFDVDRAQFRVLDGQAMVRAGVERVRVKGGRELALNVIRLIAQKFDTKSFEGSELYERSTLRSAYLAEANVDAAPGYLAGCRDKAGWFGPGSCWDPPLSCYTFIPNEGIFYSPYGWGFYSPGWAYRARSYFGDRYSHAWGSGMPYAPGV
jgi:hypothetical protein